MPTGKTVQGRCAAGAPPSMWPTRRPAESGDLTAQQPAHRRDMTADPGRVSWGSPPTPPRSCSSARTN